MKDINKQIDRIKQLFTEERLHGNLIKETTEEVTEEESDEVTEQLGKRIKQGVKNVKANRAEKKAERKQKKADKKQDRATKAQSKADDASNTAIEKRASAIATKSVDSGETTPSPTTTKAATSKPTGKTSSGVSKGDFTKPLTDLGGADGKSRYILTGKNNDGKLTAKKVNSSGKTIATYVRESYMNKNSLFESVYTFDKKNIIKENWKWNEGDNGAGKVFSDSLSKKFDDAIGQIGTTIPTTVNNSNSEDTNAKSIPEEWKKYPCVYNNPDKEENKKDDGTTFFVIDNEIGRISYFNNGRCKDKKGEMRIYTCKDGKIVIGKKDKTTSAKSVDSNIIKSVGVLTGDDSWWGNITHSALSAGLAGAVAVAATPLSLPVAAVAAAYGGLVADTFMDRRKGVKGLVDALDGWVDNEDLAFVLTQLTFFKDKKYQDPVSGKLIPAITKIKELYQEDEGSDLIADIESVGTKTLSNMTLKDGTDVTADQFKEIVVKSLK
ncbi:hypothetical protein N9994_00025 [bacterium]|nr:hypothetical protein [bacterium]